MLRWSLKVATETGRLTKIRHKAFQEDLTGMKSALNEAKSVAKIPNS